MKNDSAGGAMNAIQLFTSTQELSEITNPKSREKLAHTLSTLDATLLTEEEIRNCFAGIRVAMAAFITKVNILEDSLVQLKKDQVASEARLEAMCLQARDEIRELRIELTELKTGEKQGFQVFEIAERLHGNLYQRMDRFQLHNKNNYNYNTSKLPPDFLPRLEFAQKHGFKWNQNNRLPTKTIKQLQTLEEWEKQLFAVRVITPSQAANKSQVVKIGPGAVAGALMVLERELGHILPERQTHSVFNCYQKAIRLYRDGKEKFLAQTPCSFDVKTLLSEAFSTLSIDDIGSLENRLKTRPLHTTEQVVAALKKIVSKSLLPSFITWREEEKSDIERLYAIQSGSYDKELVSYMSKYESK
jgi:hypothetical protein